jgi:F1F0 ATPase subunit 2
MAAHDLPGLLAALLGGVLLGAVHFGGLWLTVQRLPTSRRPALLAMGSLAVRMAVIAAGFVLIVSGGLGHVAAAVVGLLAVRTLAVRRIAPAPEPVGPRARDGG